MHELLIGFLIVAIVAIQIYVFSITLEKIKIFKNILPSQENFKTLKVYIKESDIETISLIDIFKNLEKYTNKKLESFEIPDLDISLPYSNNKSLDTLINDDESNLYKDNLFSDSSVCVISKKGITKEIPKDKLLIYLELGWTVN